MAGSVRVHGGGAALPAVTVRVEPGDASATSDATGSYAFTGLSGEPTIVPRRTGGPGAAASALDAAWVLQAVAGLRTLTESQRLAADVTGDGSVSTFDAVHILEYAVGLRARFDAAETCGSDWLFVPSGSVAPGATPIIPLLTLTTCRMGAIHFPSLAADATGQDFTAILLGDISANWSE